MPLVYLLHDSARTRLNVVTGMQETTFDILMWSVEAREAVYRHLKDETRPSTNVGSILLKGLSLSSIVIIRRFGNGGRGNVAHGEGEDGLEGRQLQLAAAAPSFVQAPGPVEGEHAPPGSHQLSLCLQVWSVVFCAVCSNYIV